MPLLHSQAFHQDIASESLAKFLIFTMFIFAYLVGLRWDANEGSGGTNYIIQYQLRNVDSDPAFNTSFTTADTVSPSTLSVYILYSFVYSRLQM